MPVKTIKEMAIFMVMVVLAILVAKWIGAKVPAIGAVTEKI